MSVWHLYVLYCGDGSFYVGSTTDLPRRLREHLDGKGGAYTRSRRPVCMVYHEAYPDRSAAQRREAAIKRWPRAKKLALAGAIASLTIGAVASTVRA